MSTASAEALQTAAVQHMLGRAALYRLLSLAFSYPDAEALEQLAGLIDDVDSHAIAPALDLRAPLHALAQALESASLEALEGDHTRLFAGSVECSAHETEYEADPFAKARQLADISGFYEAFGLQVSTSRPGLPDFIGTEMEFMGMLVLKQAYAAVHGWEKEQQVSADAQRAFVEDHLGRWAPAFCANLAGQDPGLYAGAAGLCGRFLAAEVELLAARPLPLADRFRVPDDPEAFKCGLATPPGEDEEGEWGPEDVRDFVAVAPGPSPAFEGLFAVPPETQRPGTSGGGERA